MDSPLVLEESVASAIERVWFSVYTLLGIFIKIRLTCDLMKHESDFDLMKCRSDTYFWLKKWKLDFDVRKCKSVFDL